MAEFPDSATCEPRAKRDPRSRAAGFSLIECLVGLALLTVALLMGISLLAQEARAMERLEAHAEAWAAVETTSELIRGGVLDLVNQTPSSAFFGTPNHARGLVVFVEVQPEGRPDLHRVQVAARYSVQGRIFWRKLSTLVWEVS